MTMFHRLLLLGAVCWLVNGVLTCSREELTLTAEVPSYYTCRLPADYDSTGECPLVIALHGRDQDEGQMTALWDQQFFYDPNFILLSIRAPFRAKNGYAWMSENASNPTSDPYAVVRASAKVSAERILQTLDDFSEQYGVDDVEIYLMGFAQGAQTAFYTAFKHPDVFAGIASEGGNVDSILNPPKTLGKAGYLDIYMSVGREENPDFLDAVEQTADRFARLGSEIDFYVHDGGHVITWQSCRRMQNTFMLSNSDAPEDNFSGSSGGGLQTDDE
jgi:predicted esterase